MKEPKYKPIIFSAPMVRAILEGRKTQTRRIVKPVRNYERFCHVCRPDLAHEPWDVWWHGEYESVGVMQKCPYGQPGGRLWVRENWRIGAWDENNGRFALDYCDGPDKRWITVPESTDDYLGEGVFEHYWMQCSDELSKKGILPDSGGQYHWEPGKSPLRWRSSRFMPRWASRITLEVTGVRVERLQDISEDDAYKEGAKQGYDYPLTVDQKYVNSIEFFSRIWNSIRGPGAWEKNPWVWVIEFKRLEE